MASGVSGRVLRRDREAPGEAEGHVVQALIPPHFRGEARVRVGDEVEERQATLRGKAHVRHV